jgi:hypothetical protein
VRQLDWQLPLQWQQQQLVLGLLRQQRQLQQRQRQDLIEQLL